MEELKEKKILKLKIELVRHSSRSSKQLGFSLVSMLFAILISGILMTSVSSIIVVQSKENRAIYQKLHRSSLNFRTLSVLRDQSKCSCQFGHITLSTNLKKDFIVKSCSPPSSEIIATSDQAIGSSVKLSSVQLTNVKVSNQYDSRTQRRGYYAEVIIKYESDTPIRPLIRSLRPTVIPLLFTTDNTGLIIECQGNTKHTVDIANKWDTIDGRVREEEGLVSCLEKKTTRNQGRTDSLPRRHAW